MSEIKRFFTSRFGQHGFIVEADFSQLEVIGLAFLSGDEQLRADILSGKDRHCINAEFLYGKPYDLIKHAVDQGDEEWVLKRKKAKAPGFLIQYGGGAEAMSKQTGLSKEQCQEFIENYYRRYTGVKQWQDDIADEVKSRRVITDELTEGGQPRGVGWHVSITGRKYVFKEYDAPDFLKRRGTMTSFSPTQMKNYPVQGFATGDIVPLVLGEVCERFYQDRALAEKALLINTVHDSILLDVHKDILYEACKTLKETMEEAPKLIEGTFGLKFDLPLEVGVSYGKNWLEQVEWRG